MARQCGGHRDRMHLPEPGACLDIRKEEGDGSGRQHSHLRFVFYYRFPHNGRDAFLSIIYRSSEAIFLSLLALWLTLDHSHL